MTMKVCLFGHPYAPIGMGEQLASFSDALDVCYFNHQIYDIYGSDAKPKDIRPWLIRKESNDNNGADVRIFHINGDEIEPCINHLEKRGLIFSNSYNIIVPAWELPIYPKDWRPGINRFDEVWSISKYVEKMFLGWAKPIVRYVGQSAQRRNGVIFPRKYFGIKDSAIVFLSFFDQSSFFTRKNPEALIEFYDKLRKIFPYGDFQMVLKAKDMNRESSFGLQKQYNNLIFINGNLTYDEITSLIDSADIFVCLHRAEGFGRGPAEAVLRKKRAILTNYSGVEDYASDPAILPVDYDLIALKKGDYPHYKGQMWADPKVEEAVVLAKGLIKEHQQGISNQIFYSDNPEAGKIVQSVASNFSVGTRILENLHAVREILF